MRDTRRTLVKINYSKVWRRWKLSVRRAECLHPDPSNLAQVELGEREAFASKVLERRADVKESLVVHDEEVVVA